jgi:hypothetical protein
MGGGEARGVGRGGRREERGARREEREGRSEKGGAKSEKRKAKSEKRKAKSAATYTRRFLHFLFIVYEQSRRESKNGNQANHTSQ